MHEVGAEMDPLLFQQGSPPWCGAATSAAWWAGEGLLSLPQVTGYVAASPCKERDRGSPPTSPFHPPQGEAVECPLTCLHLGMVHSVGDFLLTEEVVNDLHPDGGLRVPPLQHHQCAAWLVNSGEPQAGGQCWLVSILGGQSLLAVPTTHPCLPSPTSITALLFLCALYRQQNHQAEAHSMGEMLRTTSPASPHGWCKRHHECVW